MFARLLTRSLTTKLTSASGVGLITALGLAAAAPPLLASNQYKDDRSRRGAEESVGQKAAQYVLPTYAAQTSDVPGEKKYVSTIGKEMVASTLQTKAPLQSIHNHVCGIHFYSGEPQRQVIAHHYCAHVNEDFHQCVLYDANEPNARLIGIEYIISEKLFKSLPDEEKQFWHSHGYEVKSGVLVAPALPEMAERAFMKDLVTTYGKTIHTWQIDRDPLPFGSPSLMMAFTRDGMANPQLIAEKDQQCGSSTQDRRESRAEIPTPKKAQGADAWETGKTPILGVLPKKY